MALTPSQRMKLAHIIARATIERAEWEEAGAERIDYRVTFGASLTLVYAWERKVGEVYWRGLRDEGNRPYVLKPIVRLEERLHGGRTLVDMELRQRSTFTYSDDVLHLDVETMQMSLSLSRSPQNITGELLCSGWREATQIAA